MRSGGQVERDLQQGRRYRLAVLALVMLSVVLRAWSVNRWSWNSDDWIYMDRVTDLPFLAYLFQNYNSHFMPGQFLVVWLITTLAPLQHEVVMVVTAAWSGVNTLLWGRALGGLTGERVRSLVPLVLLSFTPLLIQPTIWWAAALQTLAFQTTFAACVLYSTRLVHTKGQHGRRALPWAFVLGLVMWEKSLLLVIPVTALVVFHHEGTLRDAVRRYGRTGATLGAICVAYVSVYALGLRIVPGGINAVTPDADRSLSSFATFYLDLVTHLLAPGLLGGPWGSLPIAEEFDSRPAVAVQVACAALLAGVLVWVLATRARAWVPVAMVVAYSGIAWGTVLFSSRFEILAWHRLGYERYAIDIFTVWCLALAMLLAGPAVRLGESAERIVPMTAVRWSKVRTWSSAGALALLICSLVAANWQALQRVGTSPAKPWVETVLSELDHGEEVTLVDSNAPNPVMEAVFWKDEARLSNVLSPLGDRLRFNSPAERLHMITEDGRVRPVTVEAASQSLPGPVPDCGYLVNPGESVMVTMVEPLFAWEWGIEIVGHADEDTTLLVDTDGVEVEVTFEAGANEDKFLVNGPVEDVLLSVPSGLAAACVGDISAGPFVPSKDRS